MVDNSLIIIAIWQSMKLTTGGWMITIDGYFLCSVANLNKICENYRKSSRSHQPQVYTNIKVTTNMILYIKVSPGDFPGGRSPSCNWKLQAAANVQPGRPWTTSRQGCESSQWEYRSIWLISILSAIRKWFNDWIGNILSATLQSFTCTIFWKCTVCSGIDPVLRHQFQALAAMAGHESAAKANNNHLQMFSDFA